MSQSVWIVTLEYNNYDQLGGYFYSWFPKKPTSKQLKDIGVSHIGRKNYEDTWYELDEVECGQAFMNIGMY